MKINYYVEYDKEENMYFIYRRFPNEIKLPLRLVCDKLNSQSDLIEDLERQLALTEKALELACEMLCGVTVWDNELVFDEARKDCCEYFIERAKEIMKSE